MPKMMKFALTPYWIILKVILLVGLWKLTTYSNKSKRGKNT
jgi:hypothetical protein